MNFGKFDQKTVEKSIINTIFKQQANSEPQKLLHFSRAWALVTDKLVACKTKKCIDHYSLTMDVTWTLIKEMGVNCLIKHSDKYFGYLLIMYVVKVNFCVEYILHSTKTVHTRWNQVEVCDNGENKIILTIMGCLIGNQVWEV